LDLLLKVLQAHFDQRSRCDPESIKRHHRATGLLGNSATTLKSQLALQAHASWLVTRDDDLLLIPVIEALNVLTPAQALVAWQPG
jgi:hypothetical protein